MKVTINEDRSVRAEEDVFGVIGENKAEVLEFDFPEGFENYHKTIEINTGENKFVDVIENNRYELSYAITKYDSVRVQIVAKDLKNDTVFKSEIFRIKFKEAINATEELVEEKKVIIEKIIEDIEEIKKKTENLSSYDDTTIKQEISEIKTSLSDIEEENTAQDTAIDNLETELGNISSILDNVNGEVV